MSSCCPPPPDKLLLFRKGLDTGEALVVRSVLEGNGISVFLANENMAAMHYAVAADIIIRSADRQEAEAVMANVSVFPSQAMRYDDEEIDDCPYCGSTHVFKFIGDVPVFMGFGKSKAIPGSPWRKCLQCSSFFRVDAQRLTGHFPLALLWGGALGGFVYGLIKFLDWVKWL